MTVLGPRIGQDTADPKWHHAQFRAGPLGRELGLSGASSSPGDQRPADSQERSRVFDGYLQGGDRSRDDEVVSTAPFAKALRPSIHNLDIREPADADRSLEKCALPGRALKQDKASPRQGDRQGQRRKPGARAEIECLGRVADRIELKRYQ